MKTQNRTKQETNKQMNLWLIVIISILVVAMVLIILYFFEKETPKGEAEFIYQNNTGRYNITISQGACIYQCQEVLLSSNADKNNLENYMNECASKCIEVFE